MNNYKDKNNHCIFCGRPQDSNAAVGQTCTCPLTKYINYLQSSANGSQNDLQPKLPSAEDLKAIRNLPEKISQQVQQIIANDGFMPAVLKFYQQVAALSTELPTLMQAQKASRPRPGYDSASYKYVWAAVLWMYRN